MFLGSQIDMSGLISFWCRSCICHILYRVNLKFLASDCLTLSFFLFSINSLSFSGKKKLAKEKQKNASVMNRTILFKSVRRSATKNDKHNRLWIGFILLVVVTLGIFVIPFVHDIMIIESNDKCNHIRWFYFEIRTL